jgi:hypothetical protein
LAGLGAQEKLTPPTHFRVFWFLSAPILRNPTQSMETLEFLVQGSEPDPYRVTFKKQGQNLNAYCTCAAGQNGMYCKHRFNIFSGSTDGVVSPNSDKVPIVAGWLPGTDVEKAMKAIIALEKEQSRLKKEISAAKRALAQTLLR